MKVAELIRRLNSLPAGVDVLIAPDSFTVGDSFNRIVQVAGVDRMILNHGSKGTGGTVVAVVIRQEEK